jgi:spermidine synthase
MLTPPLEVRGLITQDGTLWMSDVPQERLMMFNNAQASSGRVLVGGMGLGLYPQYVISHIESLTIIEQNAEICRVIEPLVRIAADSAGVPVEVNLNTVEKVLNSESADMYHTIFLDTWETLDAANLPAINRLREAAFDHLAPGGRVLLWGYAWMLRLFGDACRQLLQAPPAERTTLLIRTTHQRPDVQRMLTGVLDHFAGQIIEDWDAAIRWCRDYAVQVGLN